MTIATNEKNRIITILLNSANKALRSIVPINFEMSKPTLMNQSVELQFGVLIGVLGDVKGRLILAGERTVFGSIGEVMYGMSLEGEMLTSFSGELGNMLVGGISTDIANNDLKTDITAPTILEGNTKLSGYESAIQFTVHFENIGEMEMYFLV